MYKRHIFATLVCALLFLLCSCSSSATLLPYGIEFGSSYETVLKKDSNAEPPTDRDNGHEISSSSLDGTFFGYKANAMSISVRYDFGTNDTLEGISLYITLDSTLNDSDFLSTISQKYDTAYGQHTETPLGLCWESAIYEVELIYWDTGMFTIGFDAL